MLKAKDCVIAFPQWQNQYLPWRFQSIFTGIVYQYNEGKKSYDIKNTILSMHELYIFFKRGQLNLSWNEIKTNTDPVLSFILTIAV